MDYTLAEIVTPEPSTNPITEMPSMLHLEHTMTNQSVTTTPSICPSIAAS